MKKQILTSSLITFWVSFLLTTSAFSVNKPQFQYIAYPDSIYVDSEGELDICLVNYGSSGDIVYDGIGDFDQAIISIPIGTTDSDLVHTNNVTCVSQNPMWEGTSEVVGNEILLTLHPVGIVTVQEGETICFQITTIYVNSEVGLSFLSVDQQMAGVAKPLNTEIGIFKTTTTTAGTVEIDPTVPSTIKDGVDWTEVTNIPAGFADGTDDVGITAETDPTVAASVRDGVDWTEVTNIPADIADGDQVGITAETDPTVAASVRDGVDWTEVSGIPAGFADGVDNIGSGDGHSLDAADGDPVDAIYVDNSGNVVIGTASHETNLEVAGKVKSSSGGFEFPDGSVQITAAKCGNGVGGIDPYTKLLLHMDDTGLIDSSLWTHTVILNGNITRSSTQSKFGGYSAYFDGDGDYLSIPDSEDWSFGSGDFTIDFWVWFENFNNYYGIILDFKHDGSDSQILAHHYQTGWFFSDRSGIGYVLNEGSVNTPLQTWVHVALVRNGNDWNIYLNGNSVVSDTLSTTLTDPTNLDIGYCQDGLVSLNGYIDEFRITKGLARWTSNFTPPSAPYDENSVAWGEIVDIPAGFADGTDDGVGDGHSLDGVDGGPIDALYVDNAGKVGIGTVNPSKKLEVAGVIKSTSGGFEFPDGTVQTTAATEGIGCSGIVEIDSYTNLLLRMDSVNLSDSSATAHPVTINGDVVRSYTESGGYCAYFDGDGDYLSIPSSDDWLWGNSDWTIDFWIKTNQISDFIIMGRCEGTGIQNNWDLGIRFDSPSGILVVLSNGVESYGAKTAIINNGVWHHVAFVRKGATVKSFTDGILSGTLYIGSDYTIQSRAGCPLEIGRYPSIGTAYFKGFIDEFRISKGIARWESDFTPPNGPYCVTGNCLWAKSGDDVFRDTGNVGIGTTSPQGKLDVNGSIYQRGGLLHADYVFEPEYKLESIEDHAKFMWANKHLKGIPRAKKDENGQEIVEVGAHRKGIVEELEKAHIYIEQLHAHIKEMEEKIAVLKAIEKKIGLLEAKLKGEQ